MKILAIETATSAGGIAILDDAAGLLLSYQLHSRLTHSERLMPAIAEAFAKLELDLAAIDVIGVSIGPGSFTGVRIGISAAKGLALAGKKALVGVHTLEALACRFYLPQRLVCPLIDARRAEVYGAFFEVPLGGDSLRRLGEDFVAPPEKVLEKIKQPTVFSGGGALRYRELIKTTLGEKAEFAPPHRTLPSADEVAFLTLTKWQKGETADPFSLEPNYIRQSDAEIKVSQKPAGSGHSNSGS